MPGKVPIFREADTRDRHGMDPVRQRPAAQPKQEEFGQPPPGEAIQQVNPTAPHFKPNVNFRNEAKGDAAAGLTELVQSRARGIQGPKQKPCRIREHSVSPERTYPYLAAPVTAHQAAPPRFIG